VARKLPDDPAPWTVLSSTYLFRKPPWLTLRQDHFRLPSGRDIPEYWIQEFPPWVNVVAVTEADQLILVRQYRPGIAEVHYELPAGVVDPEDPDLESAARRELLEETGHGGGTWSRLSALSANPALTTNLTHTFLAEGVVPLPGGQPDATEDLRVHLLPVAEAQRLIEESEMVQALHAAPLLLYLLRRAYSRRATSSTK
jgi:8-oxo-dGTP pyrophosphatase MutT (NUDIX family)